MGDGPQTPDNRSVEEFNQRQSEPVTSDAPTEPAPATTTGAQTTTSDAQESTSGGNNTQTSDPETTTDTTSNNSSDSDTAYDIPDESVEERLVESGNGPAGSYLDEARNNVDQLTTDHYVQAAMVDVGRNTDIASHFNSASTEELTEAFKSRLGAESIRHVDAASVSAETRFIGGVAASRPDSDITAHDVFGDEMVHVDDESAFPDAEETVLDHINDTLQELDEYAAGKICEEIEGIRFRSRDEFAGSKAEFDVESNELHLSPTSGVRDTRLNTIGPERRDVAQEWDGPDKANVATGSTWGKHREVRNVMKREMMQAYCSALNIHPATTVDDTATVADFEDIDPDEHVLWHEISSDVVTPEQLDVGEDFQHAANLLLDTEYDGGHMMTGIVPDGEPPMRVHHELQKATYAEMVAHGYELYSNDLLASVTEQRPLADAFDRHVTGGSWEKTSVESLRTTGGTFRNNDKHDQIARRHIPGKHKATGTVTRQEINQRGEPERTVEDFGDVALIELNDPEFRLSQGHVAGIVTDVNADTVTVSYLGHEIDINRNKIDNVKRRVQ